MNSEQKRALNLESFQTHFRRFAEAGDQHAKSTAAKFYGEMLRLGIQPQELGCDDELTTLELKVDGAYVAREDLPARMRLR